MKRMIQKNIQVQKKVVFYKIIQKYFKSFSLKNETFHQLIILSRQELLEVTRSRLPVFSFSLYLVFFILFFFVAQNESSMLRFTGMNRVLFSLFHGLLFFLPLLALISTSTSVNQSRENGTLEFMFSHPISKPLFLTSTLLVRYLVLILPLIGLSFGAWIFGILLFGESIKVSFFLKMILISSTLIWAFSTIGLFISVSLRHQARALLAMLFIWMGSICLIDLGLIGLLLKWSFPPHLVFFLASLNPLEMSRMALLSSMDAELSVLGPVGFYVANEFSPAVLLLAALGYPVFLGGFFWFLAQRKFLKKDII